MSDFITVANIVINRDKVLCLVMSPDYTKLVIELEGHSLTFEGSEAMEAWKAFADDKTWRDGPSPGR